MPKTALRPWLLGLALLGTLAAVFWVQQMDDTVEAARIPEVQPARKSVARAIQSAAIAPATERSVPVATLATDNPEGLPEFAWQRSVPDARILRPLFVAQQWLPPPPKPLPPPPPLAPPIPFVYVGTFEEMPEGKTVVLMQQSKMWMVRTGRQVTAQWRLDAEDAQSVHFTFLPLNQSVVLSKQARSAGLRQQRESTGYQEMNHDELLNQ